MTPTELRAYMHALGLSEAGLARLLRLGWSDDARQHARTVRRWKSGENPIPRYVDMIMESYIQYNGVLPDIAEFMRR